jgi:hypothetical protein
MCGNMTNVSLFLFPSLGIRALALQPIGQPLVFERHALQFFAGVGRARQLRLVTAQQFERTVALADRVMHAASLGQVPIAGTHLR